MTQIALEKLDRKQLRAWSKEQDKQRLADVFQTVMLNPVVTLVVAFVAIDFFEQKEWKDAEGKPSGNTMLGPAAANVIRTGIIAGPAMDALGKVAEVAGGFMKLKALGKGSGP
jgi:hypothetical protein